MRMRVDLDKATDRAWRAFGRDLARRFDELEEFDSFYLTLEKPEGEMCAGTPFVQVAWEEGGIVADVPRNRSLSEHHRLTKSARRQLRSLGWTRRDHADPELRMLVEDVDKSAEAIVSAFRDVWGVPHPSFLIDSDDLVPDESDEVDEWTEPRVVPPRPMRLRMAVEAHHAEQLREYVDRTLSEDLGSQVVYDSDGDIPFRAGDSVVFVRIPGSDRVELFSEFVLDVQDVRTAAHEVQVLNRDTPFLKFLLLGDRIMMTFSLPAQPLAPAHLIEVLDVALKVAESTAPDVAFRVGGRCFLGFPTSVPDEE